MVGAQDIEQRRRVGSAANTGGAGLAEAYEKWRASRLGKITDALEAEALLALLGPVEGLRVLDVGCGDATLALTLSRHGATMSGLDADTGMLAAARCRANVASAGLLLAGGRVETLPFADGAFDRVVAVTVLCFVKDAARSLSEMARVLKPGGRMVIGELGRFSTWAAERRLRGWLGARLWRTAKFRTAEGLRALAAGAGLEVIAVRGSVFYPPLALAARLMAPVDRQLGRLTTLGAAFVAVCAVKPAADTQGRTKD